MKRRFLYLVLNDEGKSVLITDSLSNRKRIGMLGMFYLSSFTESLSTKRTGNTMCLFLISFC